MDNFIMSRCAVCRASIYEKNAGASQIDDLWVCSESCRERYPDAKKETTEEALAKLRHQQQTMLAEMQEAKQVAIDTAKGAATGSEIVLLFLGIFWLVGAIVVAVIGLIAWSIFSAIIGSLFIFLGYVMPELRGYIYSIRQNEKEE